MEVTIIQKPDNLVDVLYLACRTCYSDKTIKQLYSELKDIPIDDKIKLIEKVFDSGHLSVAEHVSFTFAIDNISRIYTQQLTRHRIASYCLAGDTVVQTTDSPADRELELVNLVYELYNYLPVIKCIDESTKHTFYQPVKRIVKSGVKDLYMVTTALGYSLKATREHQFFTEQGWRRLKDIHVGDKTYVEHNNLIILDTITSIEYVGKGETYDITMQAPYHNFIANNFVVHNSQQSQRYVRLSDIEDVIEDNLLHDLSDVPHIQAKCLSMINDAVKNYHELIEQLTEEGVDKERANEIARLVLPNATPSNILVTMNLREIMHVCNLRLCTRAQKEIRRVFRQLAGQITSEYPFLKKYLVPKCKRYGYCDEHKSCGRFPTRREALANARN